MIWKGFNPPEVLAFLKGIEFAMLKLDPGYGYGETLKIQEVAGLILTDCVYAPGLNTPSHAHQFSYFSTLLRGSFTQVCGNRTQLFGPASLGFHPAERAHRDHFHSAGGRIFSIEVGPSWSERVSEHSRRVNDQTYYSGGRLVGLAVRLYEEFHRMDDVSALAIEGLVLEMIAEAARGFRRRNETSSPRWLESAREFLQACFPEPLTLACIADSVGVHPVHLARAFRQHHQCTVWDYVRRLRIEYACRELSCSDASLVDIALAAGFCAQSHLSTAFKRHMGLTPTQYRATFRNVKRIKSISSD